ncbi:hypothetical protein BDR26DRAFT_87340 [Obelidium mucronatum]|nr:hypothetical protein BDR26DRAFT_87340 [Obelidium mucronatum]
MDIAFYENSRFYHTRFDSLNNIRAEDVQYMGSNALSLIKALRDAEWIDDLKVQTSSPFFDNFGGYSGVVLSPTVVNLLLSILAIGTLCIIGAGLWNLKFPSQEKSENPSTLRDLLLQVLFGVLVSIFGSLIGALCILVPFVSGIFTGKALNGQWTVAPLALLGCICAAYLASQFWRKNHLTRASLLLGTVVALVFLSLNLPFANIIAIVGVARLLAHICIDILRNHASMLFPSISPFSTEMAISFTVCVISIYPTCIIVDTIIVFARCTVGLYFQILVPALVGYTTSVLFMPVLLDMKSHQARRIVFWTTMVLVLALSLYSLVRAFV